MIDPRRDEQAALAALGWLDDPAALARDPEAAEALRGYADVLALLAHEAPQHQPPADLRQRLMGQLDGPLPVLAGQGASLFRSPRFALPYILAACLMGLILFQTALILMLDQRLGATHSAAVVSVDHANPLAGMQLADLAPMGDHGNARVMVAWDPKRSSGMVHMQDMPSAPAGSDYQLWVLDPSKPAPVSAGIIPHGSSSQHFLAREVRMPGRPGFAVSLEPAGGRPTPTTILFAVAPSP
jgi:hypothetical protein